MGAAGNVAAAQAPGHAVRANQVAAVAADALGLDAEAMQPKSRIVQPDNNGGDLGGGLSSADRAKSDQWLRSEIHPGPGIHGHAGQIVVELPALDDRNYREVRRQLPEA